MKRYNSCHLERCINTLVATNCSVSFKEIKYNKEILLLAIYATCVYKNKHQLVCFCSVQFVSTQNTDKDHRWSMNRLKISWGTNRQSELRGVVSHPCVSRPGRRLDQVRGDHQLPRIIKPRSRRKSTFIYHQVDALSCCRNHQVRMDCALIIIPFCRYKWNAIQLTSA